MKLLVVLGTRPEAIKLAPVILEARKDSRFQVVVLSTGQHRELLRPVLELFGIKPDIDLDLMKPAQTLEELAAGVLQKLPAILAAEKPDWVIVQGDTSTAMMAALCAYWRQIPVVHVEAGLRTDRRDAPFPEEVNRRMIGQVARWHFAPTEGAKANLLRDAVDVFPDAQIAVTGNTGIDALFTAVELSRVNPHVDQLLTEIRRWKSNGGRIILVTGHRRENFGEPFKEFCRGLQDIAQAHPDTLLVYPVHLNPNVQAPVRQILGENSRIRLVPPADYPLFVALMSESHLIITDSGGVQEEAPALGKPVVVTRDVTERPEAVEAGGVILVGPNRLPLFQVVNRLLTDAAEYARMAQPRTPYGDGHAARRCLDCLLIGT